MLMQASHSAWKECRRGRILGAVRESSEEPESAWMSWARPRRLNAIMDFIELEVKHRYSR